LDSKRKIFVEPRERSAFSKVIHDFKNVANQDDGLGAILLAVFRGKASEGIDFAGNQCKAVILFSIPFPNPKEPITLLKKNFQDDRSRETRYRLPYPEMVFLF
jgi:Rad3-related DNA helicase